MPVQAQTISGAVDMEGEYLFNEVIDSQTLMGIENAKIYIPSKNYTTHTDEYGRFQLEVNIAKPTVISVEKAGYRPFSVTINANSLANPLKFKIDRAHLADIVLENNYCHLGDNIFSENSANSNQFRVKSTGPYYNRQFQMKPLAKGETAYLKIGSVIGLDTKIARELGQNEIANVYSSPAEVYFNGHKIGELIVNGDDNEIRIPNPLVKQTNELTIKTGRNLFQSLYVDYDDIEIMNISILVKQKQTFANIIK